MIEIGLIGCVALYKILVKSYILLVGLEDYVIFFYYNKIYFIYWSSITFRVFLKNVFTYISLLFVLN